MNNDIEWIIFNDDGTPKGIEGKYVINNNTLIVFINATNSCVDWLIDFLAFPVPIEFFNWELGWGHIGFKSYSYWLTGVIDNILAKHSQVNKVKLCGYSMGGGVAQFTAVICGAWIDNIEISVLSIDGPMTTTKLPKGNVLYNKGSIISKIPFWFKRLPSVCLNENWRPIWKAHADYDINKILKKILEA